MLNESKNGKGRRWGSKGVEARIDEILEELVTQPETKNLRDWANLGKVMEI